MSSGTKVALVALMVLMMVVIARLVNDESEADGLSDGDLPNAGQKEPARTEPRQANPAGRSVSTPRGPTRRPPKKEGTRLSANIGARSTNETRSAPPARGLTPSRRTPSAQGPGRAALPDAGRPARGDSPTSIGPISGAPPGVAPRSPSRSGVSGVGSPRSKEPPVSIAGDTSSGERGAPQQPMVSTVLAAKGPNGTKNTLPTGSSRTPSRLDPPRTVRPGANGTSRDLADGTTKRPGAGQVKVRDFNVSKSDSTPSGFDFPISYTIKPGDNLWNLAEHFYGGRGYLHTHIKASNPGVKIHPGKTLTIPAPPLRRSTREAERATPGEPATTIRRYGNTPPSPATAVRPTPSKMYVVRKGENLWKIAGRAYGDPTQYLRIKRANPHVTNADHVKAGTKILIP